VDTLEEFLEKSALPLNLFFITGLDALLSIDKWKDYRRLVSLCTLVTARRPGYSIAELEALPFSIRSVLKLVEIPQFAISSTEIRSRARDGRGIRFLVPHLVESYIESCGLYKEWEVSQC
jgi:nicotinate-nucleotide adenylyltransferase